MIYQPLGRGKFIALDLAKVPSADTPIFDHLGNTLPIYRLINKMMNLAKLKPSLLLAGLTFFAYLSSMVAFAQPTDSSLESLNFRIRASLGVANCLGDLNNPSLMSANLLSMLLAKSKSPPDVVADVNAPDYQVASDIILQEHAKRMKRVLYSKLVTILAQNLSDEQIEDAERFCSTASGKHFLKLLFPVEFLELELGSRDKVLAG